MEHLPTEYRLFVVAAGIGWAIPVIIGLIVQPRAWRTLMVVLGALALLGAFAGVIGGLSRVAVVGSVLPAVFGLLGGVVIYLFGLEPEKGLMASLGASALAISITIGFISASKSRTKVDNFETLRAACLGVYTSYSGSTSDQDQMSSLFMKKLGPSCDIVMDWGIPTDLLAEYTRAAQATQPAADAAGAAQAPVDAILTPEELEAKRQRWIFEFSAKPSFGEVPK